LVLNYFQTDIYLIVIFLFFFMKNAFESRITESCSKDSFFNPFFQFMEKKGMFLGSASLALGVMMMGGTFLMNNIGLKADITEEEPSTTSSEEAVASSSPISSASTSISPEASASVSEEEAASSSNTSSTSTTTQTSEVESSSSNQISTPLVSIAETAPAPNDKSLSVPSALLEVDESDLTQALQAKEPEVLPPSEKIGD